MLQGNRVPAANRKVAGFFAVDDAVEMLNPILKPNGLFDQAHHSGR